MPLWYTGLPPGSKVRFAPANLSSAGAPCAAEPAPFASGEREEVHALGDHVAGGYTDVVLEVHLGPASYAVLVGSPA